MQFHWWRGVVDVDTSVVPWKATKKALDKNRYWAVRKEAAILKKLNASGISFVPQVGESGDGRFSYTRIPWEAFDKVYAEQSPTIKKQLTHEFIDKAYALDCLGIIHGELDRPMNNILVEREKMNTHQPSISFIDFERGYWQDFSWKNLRHVTQWLHRIWLISLEECRIYWTYDAHTLYTTLKKMQTINNHLTPSSWVSTFLFALCSITVLIALDLISKYFFYTLARGSSNWLLTPVLNTWIWRSIPVPLWITISVAVLFGGGVLLRMKKNKTFPRWGILLIAGAWWNGIDRILLWWVRDFIDFHYWPVFNFADIYLTGACIVLIYLSFLPKEIK